MDSGPLGILAHPRRRADIADWLEEITGAGIDVIIPEIVDYELRRAFLLEGLSTSLQRLDQLKEVLTYKPITTAIMVRAAEMWAEVRRRGKPTADAHALDGDVILAAQAEAVHGMVATENVGHLSLLVEARRWSEIRPDQTIKKIES